jgi:hypothetical protein
MGKQELNYESLVLKKSFIIYLRDNIFFIAYIHRIQQHQRHLVHMVFVHTLDRL